MGLAESYDSPVRWENSMVRGAQISGALPGGARASVTVQILNVPGSRPATHMMARVTGDRLFAARQHKDTVRSVLSTYGRTVNLNVACRCNRGEDAVYVYAATPLILIEY